jgi:hypothetical protein
MEMYHKNINNKFSEFTDTLLMIRPTKFATNYETLSDNKFMKQGLENIQEDALNQFINFTQRLQDNSISVIVYDQVHENAVDSVFPNNWFSTHKNENFPEGLLIIYPLKSKLRRLEKNPKIIEDLKKNYKHFIDLTYLEQDNQFLESTGCLIFDNRNRKIYCNLSERATPQATEIFISKFNEISKSKYKLITFKAFDDSGNSIYHTNVMLSILDKHVVICSQTIKDKEQILNELKDREIIDISYVEMLKFGCNVLNVINKDNDNYIVMSKTAYENYSPNTKNILKDNYKLCICDIEVIEFIGGGSARCMIAEIFN